MWKNWPFVAAVAALVLLAIAHGFQTFGHLQPCELCLKERRIYWFVVAIGFAGGAVARVAPKFLTGLCLLIALLFLGGAVLSAYHAGVEWKLWAGPASCTGGAGHSVTTADLDRLLRGGSMAVPQCDRAAWVFLGLSMAGWNVLLSLLLAVGSFRAGVVEFRSRITPK